MDSSRISAIKSRSVRKQQETNDWHLVEKVFFQKINTCAAQPILSTSTTEENVTENGETEFNVNGHLKLNIGGTPYRLRIETIQKRHYKGLLYKFALMDHEARLHVCNGFIEETKEYFFERSPMLFESIYLYYISGKCHKPITPCLEVFANDLAYWGLTEVFFAKCCWAEAQKGIQEEKEETTQLDVFKNVHFSRVRRKIWQLIEIPESSVAARIFSFLSILAVLVSNIGLILGSIKQCQQQYNKTIMIGNNTEIVVIREPHYILEYVEYGCIALFTIEYLAKMVVAPNRRQVFVQPMNMIDLIAIVPFYIEITLYLMGLDTESFQDVKGALLVMRILRVLRVIRLLKLGRYSTGLQIFAKTMHRSSAQLGMLLVVLAIGIMFFATMLYFIEKDEQGTKFLSIPAGFWWCIVTMTTVGYGDMYPTTIIGKLVASCCIACGVLVLALPITVMVENFMRIQEELNVTPITVLGAEENQLQQQSNNVTRWGRRAQLSR